MKPVKFKHQTLEIAKDQPQYITLPALKFDKDKEGHTVTCWKMSFKERIKVLFTGIIWMDLMSFNKPLTPSFLSVNRKEVYSIPCDNIKWFSKIKLIK